MQFAEDEDDAFQETAGRLISGFTGWLDENELVAEPMSAELLLQYKWLAADGDLADWPLEQVETFLDGWCPRIMAEHRLPLRLVPLTVAVFLEYLDECGLLTRDSPRPSQIRRLCTAYADDYDELEAGPVHPVLAEFDTPPDPVRLPGPARRAESAAAATIVRDARALAQWCGEKGRQLTRTGNLRLADARHLATQLGTDDLDAARYARLHRADRLVNLTWILETAVLAGAVQRENGRLVAGARFAGLDDTSAHEDLVLAAREAGALTVSMGGQRRGDDGYDLGDDLLGGLLDDDDDPDGDDPNGGPDADDPDGAADGLADPGGTEQDGTDLDDEATERALEILARELGSTGDGSPPDDELAGELADELAGELLDRADGTDGADGEFPEPADDATPAFLALLRHPDDGMAFDDLAALLDLVLDWNDGLADLPAFHTARLVERLERLGLVAWTDTTTERDDLLGEDRRTGGRITPTPGGVACALLALSAEGLGFPSRPDPAVASVAEIVDLAGEVPPDEWRSDIDAWHAAQPDKDGAVAAFVTRALAPEQPLVVVLTATSVAAERFGADLVDDLLARHLDGPHRAQVARRLVARGRLDPQSVEPELLLRASVDVLAVTVDTIGTDEWPALFAREFPPETVEVFDDLWRLDHPRLGEVLAEIGGFHPDKRVAKAARKALVRWQSRTGGS
ncbi:hypothetical protein SAMN05216207_100467 [Pseudonocardia ammonioxydans]|uniref:Uncharacterized protein n=2 Tax=Pseudonocardia ammonioxydans TaxID=260086 RepID=A0A1I4UG92_PSUAM|nr:hypothetical protein SAMN05216207_100467 [Pseudonocardia ammonioxydans]